MKYSPQRAVWCHLTNACFWAEDLGDRSTVAPTNCTISGLFFYRFEFPFTVCLPPCYCVYFQFVSKCRNPKLNRVNKRNGNGGWNAEVLALTERYFCKTIARKNLEALYIDAVDWHDRKRSIGRLQWDHLNFPILIAASVSNRVS